MKAKITSLSSMVWLIIAVALIALGSETANAQGRSRDRDRDRDRGAREVYTGTIYYFGGPRGSVSTTFTLNIDSLSPDSEVQRFVETLQRDGQDGLLRVLGKEKRGTLQVGSSIGRDINAVWVSEEGKGARSQSSPSAGWDLANYGAARDRWTIPLPISNCSLTTRAKAKAR
jgi:hypothetical protein